jgi:hypothetical protein
MRGLACAAACLPAGFGVAAATGIRPLGGLVLLVLALLAGRWSGHAAARQASWYAVVLACFIASHLLADTTGAWGAVAIVTAVATAAYVAILRGYSSSYSDSDAVWPPLPSQRRTSR